MPEQHYTEAGDAVVTDGGWECEHTDGTSYRMGDAGELTDCPECGTRWMPWTYGMKRLAKPVVQRMV